jgi:hypothetical protein
MYSNTPEGFKNTQNFPYTNSHHIADDLDYGAKSMKGMYMRNQPPVNGPSSYDGVNQNSNSDVFDNRGYKWTKNGNSPEIDVLTDKMDRKELQQKFERTYYLDPAGDLAPYDINNNEISPNCCPAQYAPPFNVTGKEETNCDFAQKYVANNYSGMNYKDGYGCVCMTPNQAEFYGSRGGNTA